MKRLLWLAAGAAGAAAVLVASPETYTRLRERVAGGPVGELMPGDEYDFAPPPPAPPPPAPPPPPAREAEPEAADDEDEDDDDTDEISFPPPPPPPAPDQAADALRARIGESRSRLREKAMAATPESEGDEDEVGEEREPAGLRARSHRIAFVVLEWHGPGGPSGLQNRQAVVAQRLVGSTPAPLR